MTKHILFHGNGTLLNRGCEAIVRTTLSILKEHEINHQIVNFQSSPYREEGDFFHSLSIPHFCRDQSGKAFTKPWITFRIKQILRRRYVDYYNKFLGQARIVLSLGGDNYSLDYGFPNHYLDAITRANKKQVPFVLWGSSIGPFSANPEFEEKALEILQQCKLLLVRESNTKNYLSEKGIVNNVKLVADPAFLLEPEKPTSLPDKLVEQLESRQAIGFNLSPLLARYRGGIEQWRKDAANILEGVLSFYKGPVVLIPHVIAHHDNDDVFLRELYKITGSKDNVYTIPKECNCQHLKWIISRLRLFIGARTHATIAAFSSGIPTISIGYSSKAKGINYDLFGHTNWMIPHQSLKAENLIEKTEEILERESSIINHLNEIMPEYQDKARSAGIHLKEILS